LAFALVSAVLADDFDESFTPPEFVGVDVLGTPALHEVLVADDRVGCGASDQSVPVMASLGVVLNTRLCDGGDARIKAQVFSGEKISTWFVVFVRHRDASHCDVSVERWGWEEAEFGAVSLLQSDDVWQVFGLCDRQFCGNEKACGRFARQAGKEDGTRWCESRRGFASLPIHGHPHPL
jgi:hypothetical protein